MPTSPTNCTAWPARLRDDTMNILYLCHRFPFPPKRGGKIRPFNMIRHLQAAGHSVTVCSLVRSRGRGRRRPRHRRRTAPPSTWARVQRAAAVRAHDRAAAADHAVVDGLLLLGRTGGAGARSCWQSQRWDLIFVHCSSVAQYVEHVTDVPKILDFGDMDSQKWLEYAHYKPFPLSLGYTLEGQQDAARRKAPGAPLRPVHRHHARRVADAGRLRHRAPPPTGSRTASTPVSSAPPTAPTTPTPSASSAAWTTTRTRSACSASATRSGRCCWRGGRR